MGDNARTRSRARRGTVAALAAAGLGLAAPATGHADYLTFGSNLAAPADHVEAQGADTAYWQTAFADNRGTTVPVQGQVKEIRLKGFAHSDREDGASDGAGGERMWHLQALTPEGGTVRARISSQAFDVPSRAVAGPNTITTFAPANFCVEPGEFVAFNNIGGFNPSTFPQGTPMQVFAKAPGAAVDRFTADNGTKNGAVFTPRPGSHDSSARLAGVELLMQVVLATGDDRSYECGGPNTYRPADPAPKPKPAPKPGGGDAPAAVQKTTIPRSQKVNVSKKGVAGMALYCQAGPAACNGTVAFYAGSTVIATKRYSVAAKSTGKLQVKLTRKGHKLFLKRKRKLPVTIVAVTDPGGADYTDTYKVTMRKIGG